MTPRLRIAIAALLILTTSAAHARRRSAFAPGGTTFTAYPLQSTTLIADRSDLAPLRAIVGPANIVGLGDATHGTHELFTLRLRMIDYLVHEMGFDVVALEAPFAISEKLNVYVKGGGGNPRAILGELRSRLNYFFWNSEELLAVMEWMRAYNAHRGDRPLLEFAGADIYDYAGAVSMVVEYLRTIDPAAATDADANYACVLGPRVPGTGCETSARRVRDALALRNDGTRAFHDALHAADVVLQNFHLQFYEPREYSMAANLLWIQQHRGTSGRVVYWGHQEHIGKAESPFTKGTTMGRLLSQQIGREYVAIGSLIGSGTFLQWERVNQMWIDTAVTIPEPPEGTYEWHFRRRGLSVALIPLKNRNVPGTSFRTGATSGGVYPMQQSLNGKVDAVIYVDRSTPIRPF